MQSVNSTYRAEQIELAVAIARSLNQLNLARSHAARAVSASPTAAEIGSQIELRNIILLHLRELGSTLTRHLPASASRKRSFLQSCEMGGGASARRRCRPSITNRRVGN
jgi:hypothetical protein